MSWNGQVRYDLRHDAESIYLLETVLQGFSTTASTIALPLHTTSSIKINHLPCSEAPSE